MRMSAPINNNVSHRSHDRISSFVVLLYDLVSVQNTELNARMGVPNPKRSLRKHVFLSDDKSETPAQVVAEPRSKNGSSDEI